MKATFVFQKVESDSIHSYAVVCPPTPSPPLPPAHGGYPILTVLSRWPFGAKKCCCFQYLELLCYIVERGGVALNFFYPPFYAYLPLTSKFWGKAPFPAYSRLFYRQKICSDFFFISKNTFDLLFDFSIMFFVLFHTCLTSSYS